MTEFERRYLIYAQKASEGHSINEGFEEPIIDVLHLQQGAMFWFIAATEGKAVAQAVCNV